MKNSTPKLMRLINSSLFCFICFLSFFAWRYLTYFPMYVFFFFQSQEKLRNHFSSIVFFFRILSFREILQVFFILLVSFYLFLFIYTPGDITFFSPSLFLFLFYFLPGVGCVAWRGGEILKRQKNIEKCIYICKKK